MPLISLPLWLSMMMNWSPGSGTKLATAPMSVALVRLTVPVARTWSCSVPAATPLISTASVPPLIVSAAGLQKADAPRRRDRAATGDGDDAGGAGALQRAPLCTAIALAVCVPSTRRTPPLTVVVPV